MTCIGRGIWGLKARVAAVKEGLRQNAGPIQIARIAVTSKMPASPGSFYDSHLDGWIVRIHPYYHRTDIAISDRLWQNVDRTVIDDVVTLGRAARDIAYHAIDVEYLESGRGIWCATINRQKAKLQMGQHIDSRYLPSLLMIFNNIKGVTLADDNEAARSLMMSRVMGRLEISLTDYLDSIIPGPRYVTSH